MKKFHYDSLLVIMMTLTIFSSKFRACKKFKNNYKIFIVWIILCIFCKIEELYVKIHNHQYVLLTWTKFEFCQFSLIIILLLIVESCESDKNVFCCMIGNSNRFSENTSSGSNEHHNTFVVLWKYFTDADVGDALPVTDVCLGCICEARLVKSVDSRDHENVNIC